ncbi:MAG: tripartite tricarboxylate transporter substrate-binding protein [Acidimicrobiales bacterium]
MNKITRSLATPAVSGGSRLRRVAALGLGAVAALGALSACGSTKSSTSSATTTSGSSSATTTGTAAAASYFKGKTITLISPDSPGGGYDLYARLFAPYLASALGATVNVENVNGGGTLVGTNQMAASAPNGLTLGLVNIGGDIASSVEKQPGINFDLTKLSWIGQPGQVPNVLVTQPGSGITSFSSLLHASSPVPVLDIRSGVGDLLNRVVFGAFHIPTNLLTGFNEVAALKQGFLAKDGKLIFESVPSMASLITAGEAVPLLVTNTTAQYSKLLGNIPSLSSELSSVTLSSSDSAAVKEGLLLSDLSDDFAGPPGIPAAELTVLRDAFSQAAASPALQAQATKQHLAIGPTDGATLASEVTTAVAQGSAISPYVSAKG